MNHCRLTSWSFIALAVGLATQALQEPAVAQMNRPWYGSGGSPYPSRPSYRPQPNLPNPFYPPNQGYNVNYSYYDPGSYFSGQADLVNAAADFRIKDQQTQIWKSKVTQEQIDTRRKAFDQTLYEQSMTPSTEDKREKAEREAVRRSVGRPPIAEIYNGHALNMLTQPIRQIMTQSIPGPDVPLDRDIVAMLNFNAGSKGNLGTFRDIADIEWPEQLEKYKEPSQGLIVRLVQEAGDGKKIESRFLTTINRELDKISTLIDDTLWKNMDANQTIQCKMFVTNLRDSLKVLQIPQTQEILSREYISRIHTVRDLVSYMSAKGWNFAPTLPGGEAAYVATHEAMVDYLDGTQPAGTSFRMRVSSPPASPGGSSPPPGN